MRKVLFLVLLIMVLTMEGVAFSAEQKSKLFVYNSSYDLTRGDLWEYIKDQQILLDMESYPKSFVVIGLGNTNESYSIGEMMATGTVGLSRFFWIDPKYPNKGVEIWDREFPFAAIAICNPNRIIRWDEIDGEIHKILADHIEAEEVKVAALKMEGTLFDVQFHVSSNIPKEGIRPPMGPILKDKGTRYSGLRGRPNGYSMAFISIPRNYSSWHLQVDNPFTSTAMKRIRRGGAISTPQGSIGYPSISIPSKMSSSSKMICG